MSNHITTEEIRDIRSRLRLSQRKAGEILGGGPQAFYKYESGTVKPAAAVVHLLRLLERDPSRLAELTGQEDVRLQPRMESTGIFEVTAEDIAGLNRNHLVALLGRMLRAELASHEIEPSVLHVPTNIDAPDGGEDGRLEWEGQKEKTKHLPPRLLLFQSKATSIGPKPAARTLLNSRGQLQERIREHLERGGHYVLLSNHQYTQQAIEARELAMCTAATEAGIDCKENQIWFWDAHRLAAFAQDHIGVVTWLLEQVQPYRIGSFQSLDWWSGLNENQTPFCEDERFPRLSEWLRSRLAGKDRVSRIVGLSGTGKSRLALEFFRQEGPGTARWMESRIAYATTSLSSDDRILDVVKVLVHLGINGILIIDDCPQALHDKLVPQVNHEKSRLRLVSIDFDFDPSVSSDALYNLGTADDVVAESILEQTIPVLSEHERRRIAGFADGIPRIAAMLAENWMRDENIGQLDDRRLAERLLFGRDEKNKEELLTAQLVAIFGIVGIEGEVGDDLDRLSEVSGELSTDILYRSIQSLKQRGIIQQRGRFVSLHPLPLALNLAAQQWENWRENKWERILVEDNVYLRLKRSIADRLSLLDRTKIGVKVGEYICRPNSPLTNVEKLLNDDNIRIVSALAEVAPERALDILEHALERLSTDELRKIAGGNRRQLVDALEKLCFRKTTFERSAQLMLSLAVAENESYSNNATGQFKALYPIILANTEASPKNRFAVVDDVLDEHNSDHHRIVYDALAEGLRSGRFIRMMGADQQGSGKVLESWYPSTNDERKAYWTGCIERLINVACTDSPFRESARKHLATHLPSLVRYGLIDEIEEAVDTVLNSGGPFWSGIAGNFARRLEYDKDKLPRDLQKRIESLVERVRPHTLSQKLELIQNTKQWDLPFFSRKDGAKEWMKKQSEYVRQIAIKCIDQPQILQQHIPKLVKGERGYKRDLGWHLGIISNDVETLIKNVISALEGTDPDKRDPELLIGLLRGLDKSRPECTDVILDQAIDNPVLVGWLPELTCAKVEILASDLTRVIVPLQSGLISHWSLRSFSGGAALDDLEPETVGAFVLDVFSSGREFYSVAVEIMGMYAFQRLDLLDHLRPQLRTMINILPTEIMSNTNSTMISHHFSEMINWLLEKGRNDRDAVYVARKLSEKLVHILENSQSAFSSDDLFDPVLDSMFKYHLDIVWPIIGGAIVEKPNVRYWLQNFLGDSFNIREENKQPITEISEEMLISWCHAHPDVAPAFVISTFPVLGIKEETDEYRAWHPMIRRLLDDFGDKKDVLDSLGANMDSFSWSGSLTTYYSLYLEPLRELTSHQIPKVRRWANRQLVHMQRRIGDEGRRDDESGLFYG